MTDINKGTNAYYIIQVIEPDDKKEGCWWLFRRWGRTGTDVGGKTLDKYDDKETAIDKFKENFIQKTGNKWEEREDFEKKPGKYSIVEIEYGNGKEEEEDDDMDVDKPAASKKLNLPKQVSDLVVMLFDMDIMQKTLFEMEFDLEKMPLGMLSKTQISKGYQVLNEIQTLLKSDEAKDSPKYQDCSNRFFTLIPHKFKRWGGASRMINTEEMLQEKIEMLDTLAQVQITFSLNKKEDGMDQIESNYLKLKTELKPVEEDSDEFEFINKYLENTKSNAAAFDLELMEVFEVAREGERKRYDNYCKGIPNRKLLFHGSRLPNFVGILSQGLRIAPPEAPASGYLFGKGLYFADMIQKSANYCRATKDNNVALLLLTEVALGKMYEVGRPESMDRPPKGKDSTKALGHLTPDPKADLTLADGVVVPLGKPKDAALKGASSMLHNEYIVYNTDQVCNRFLIKVKFNFK